MLVLPPRLRLKPRLKQMKVKQDLTMGESHFWIRYGSLRLPIDLPSFLRWSRCDHQLDWTRESFTLSEKLSRAVRKSFVELHRQGKIYQWHRVTNRDPVNQSVISDIEVIMKEQESKLYYIKYFVTGGQNSIHRSYYSSRYRDRRCSYCSQSRR